jgi:hypothetical protein
MKIWVVPRRRGYCGCEGESEALEGVSVLMGGSLRFEPSELPKQATVFTLSLSSISHYPCSVLFLNIQFGKANCVRRIRLPGSPPWAKLRWQSGFVIQRMTQL